MQRHKIKINCFNTELFIEVNKVLDYEEKINQISKLANVLHYSFNIYDSNSEISFLNKDKKIKPSKYLKNILEIVLKYEKLTDYYFNTNRSFIKKQNIFITDEININNPIDLGGIAKGYFMALIKEILKNEEFQYKVNFGGAIMVQQKEKIFIRNVNGEDDKLINCELEAGECIHTSSYYNQKFDNNSHIYQYYLDNVYEIAERKSISVIDKNPILADVFSTALYSMSFAEGMKYIQKYDLSVIYMKESEIYITKNLKYSKNPELNYIDID